MGTPTITDDSAGITADRSRASSAIDALLADPNEQIVQLPVDKVIAHPRNPEGRVEDVDDLVASITDLGGVQQPIVVATAAAYNAGRLEGDPRIVDEADCWVIVGGGHRRHAAARKAGLATVPAVVRDHQADAKGRKASLVENLHRKQLTAFEEAEAFSELVVHYQTGQREIADLVGCNQSHISKRLKLLKLPSSIRELVELKKMSIEDALEFAAVSDKPEVVDSALTMFNNSWMSGKDSVKRAVEGHDKTVKLKAVRDDLAASNVTVIEQRPGWQLSLREPSRLTDCGIKTERHAGEPCHAAYVDQYDLKPIYACTSPKRHMPNGESKVKFSKAKVAHLDTKTRNPNDPEANKRRMLKQLRAIRDDRRKFAGQLIRGLAGELTIADTEDLHRLATVTWIQQLDPDCQVLAELLDVTVEQQWTASTDVLRRLDDFDQDVMFAAIAIAAIEASTVDSYRRWGWPHRAYLMYLEKHGRPIADCEHERLGDTRLDDGTWKVDVDEDSPVPIPAEVRACRMCMCTDDRACDGGCSWVEQDLCSACGDALDVGLLNDNAAVG